MTRTILTHGVFDVLHPGHLAHLESARAFGDRLVVSVTADAYVNKGPGRPVFTVEQRATMLRSLRMVDEVVVCDAPNAVPSIQLVQPAVYVKGQDYQTEDTAGYLAIERNAVESLG